MHAARFASVVALALFCIAAQLPQEAPTDFSGHWKLNEGMSQNTLTRGESSRRMPGGMGGRRPGGRRPGDGPGGRGGPRAGGGPQREGPPELAGVLGPAAGELTIRQEGDRVTLIGTDAQERTVTANGKKTKTKRDDGGKITQRARWNEGDLEIETKTARAKVAEAYHLTTEGQLVVVVTLEGSGRRPPLHLRRVYDRDDSQ